MAAFLPDRVRVGHGRVLSVSSFIFGKNRQDIVDNSLLRRDGNSKMPRAGEDLPSNVTVLAGTSRTAVSTVAGLRQELVDDAVKVLFGEEMVVPVENDGDLVVHEQRMDRLLPPGSAGVELVSTVQAVASPFEESGGLDAAAAAAVGAAD